MKHRKLRLEELNRLSVEAFRQSSKQKLSVLLENVRSGHNVGAILRTSDAFLIEKVYLCGITPRPPHKEIRKTAIGAENSVDWEECPDSLTLIRQLKADGCKILVVEQTTHSVMLGDFSPEPDQAYVLVLGNEVEGVSQEVVNAADVVLEIPQYGTKHSLNVSVAAGIVLYAISAHHIR